MSLGRVHQLENDGALAGGPESEDILFPKKYKRTTHTQKHEEVERGKTRNLNYTMFYINTVLHAQCFTFTKRFTFTLFYIVFKISASHFPAQHVERCPHASDRESVPTTVHDLDLLAQIDS